MALTEETVIEKIEIVGTYDFIQLKVATIIKKDEIEIAKNILNKTIKPGDDVSGEDAKVQAIASAVHTTEVIAAYQAYLAAQSE